MLLKMDYYYCGSEHNIFDMSVFLLDINECETNNGGCEDRCANNDGSFECFCDSVGFQVGSNGLNCTGKCISHFVCFACINIHTQ